MRAPALAIVPILALGAIPIAFAGALGAPWGQGEYIEEVVVDAEGERGVAFGVVRLQFRDGVGTFVQGLAASDLVLNDGALRVEALVPVTRRPDLHFVVDLTTVEERQPFAALTTLRDIVAAFPEGRARITLLAPGRSSTVTFHIAGEDEEWVGGTKLLDFLQSPASPDLGFVRTRMKAWTPKRLHEQLATAAGQFPRDRDRERFVVLLSDGYDGDPIASYAPCCLPKCDPCVLFPLPVRIARETAVSSALGHAGAHLVFRACSARTPYFVQLLDRFSLVWAFAPATDRKRLSRFASDLEGSGWWQPEADPAMRVAAIVAEVRSRLDSYLLAFSAREGSAASFVKVEVRRKDVHAVPERIGEQHLLSNDPWLVAYTGNRGSMPWPLASELDPGSTGAVENLAATLLSGFGADRAGWSTSCPSWLRGYSERDEPSLRAALATRFSPSVIDEALRSRPPNGSDLSLCSLLGEMLASVPSWK